MNINSKDVDASLTRADAERALTILRSWASTATKKELHELDLLTESLLPGHLSNVYPDLNRS